MTARIAHSSISSRGREAKTNASFSSSPAKAGCCAKRCRCGLARRTSRPSSPASPKPISNTVAPAPSMSPCAGRGGDTSMKQLHSKITVPTRGPGFTDVTDKVRRFVRDSGIETGLLTLFIPHTSASLLIQENADPDVLRDLEDAIDRLAPRDADYRHTTEGPDDLPAHIRSAPTPTSLSNPVLRRR